MLLARHRRAARAAAGTDRAWEVVAGAFLVAMAGYRPIYSHAAFAEQMASAFQATGVQIPLVYALSGGACFLVGALTGPLADRIGTRVVAAIGMLLVALGVLVAAAADSLIEVNLGCGLLVGLGARSAYVPAMALVQRWFAQHRGLASGLAVSGIGVGTALVPPGAEALAGFGDWRVAFLGCAGLSAALGLLGASLLRPAPGEAAAQRHLSAPSDLLASPGFRRACLGVLLVSLPAVLPHAMLEGLAHRAGLGSSEALALLGLIGLGTVAGRFLLALLADAVGRRAVFLACCAGMSLSMLLWAGAEDEATLQGFAFGFGALQGGFVALLPAFVADRFGPLGLGGVLGLLYTARGLGLIAAPPALAWVAAGAGAAVALPVVAALGLLGAVALLRVGGMR
jgi:OFA family oxalate/formate antiporter-like MFS transporter